jgi:hypothetical protein
MVQTSSGSPFAITTFAISPVSSEPSLSPSPKTSAGFSVIDRRCCNSTSRCPCYDRVGFSTEGSREIPALVGSLLLLQGIVLVVRTPAFRLGFGQPEGIELSVEPLLSLSTSVPGLLHFEEFYGREWRSSIRWLIGSYCALAAVAMTGVLNQSPCSRTCSSQNTFLRGRLIAV